MYIKSVAIKSCYLILINCMILVLLSQAALSEEKYDYIEINSPSLRKIPIAIPLFKTEPESDAQLSESLANLLSESLEFTGYFKMVDRGAFLADPRKTGVTDKDINFSNWTAIGTELLITGYGAATGDVIELEMRLFDTFKKTMLLGKRYKGHTNDRRKIINRFCGEVIYTLTGKWGVFDTKIAFVSTGSGNKEIYLCDFDGRNPEPFTSNKSINLFPDWASDGKWLAYTSYQRGKPDIYIADIHRQKPGRVISFDGLNITPSWAPGKFELAATLSHSGDQDIYLLTGTGKIIKQLTHDWGIDVSPTWSPDGGKIAFVSTRSGNPQIYILDVRTNNTHRLTFQGKYNTQPSWSPHGDRIAFSSMGKSETDICTIRTDGTGFVKLTRNAGKNESPSWSPDGSMIAFSTDREGPIRIYVMTGYGTDQRRLLSLPGEQSNPKWSPRILGGDVY